MRFVVLAVFFFFLFVGFLVYSCPKQGMSFLLSRHKSIPSALMNEVL